MIIDTESEIVEADKMMKNHVRGGVIVRNEEVKKIEETRQRAQIKMKKLDIMIKRMEREKKESK
jgi:hypothetical protein